MFIPGLIILSCWVIFVLYWVISAFAVKATAERRSFGSSLAYRVPCVAGGLLVAKFHHNPYLLNIPITPWTNFTVWLGPVVCVAGLGVALWSRWTLAGNWSSDVRFKQDHQLIRKGPYRFVRHPIYTGILMMCVAPAVQFGFLHCWLGFLMIGIGLWIKLKQEERVMSQHFPEYSEYRKQVKALVPFII